MSAMPNQPDTNPASHLKYVPTPEQAAKAEADFIEHSRRWRAMGGDSEGESSIPAGPQSRPSPQRSATKYAAETVMELASIPAIVAALCVYGAACWAMVRWAVAVFRGGSIW